jgi:hypothetical protein
MLGKKLGSSPDITTLTACCENCKDLFTVWAKISNEQIRIEPQSRIKLGNNKDGASHEFFVIPRDKLYHHCGGRLDFYPDYRIP